MTVNMTTPKIYTRGSTLWIRFTLNKKVIKKSLKLEDNKNNRKIVETQIIPQLILNAHNPEFFKNKNKKEIPTINEFIETSFKLHEGERCDSTIYAYKRNYDKYIKEKFGNKKLDTITGNQITIWQNSLQKKEKLAKSTLKKIRTILYTLFQDAIEEDIISDNPVKKAKRIKKIEDTKVKRIKLTPFTISEIASILNVLEGQSKNLIATLFYTGIRAGECIGLKWENIDFEKGTISIRQQIVNGTQKEVLKTTKSRRTIPIIKSLIPFLQSQYQKTGHLNSYVFMTIRTKKHYHSAGKIREQIWVKALKSANVKYRNLHQTRGTFISTLISNGEDINYVSKIAGHENVKITFESYSEYIPKENDNFGNCFDS
ncbi:tyrosine-type recombinase/integrase [Arcobacter sp. YIC-464]|uniref:tyrosine-type recombinase/integrase n=1 Tax=Arcobacter sp. YIC-464 TaxID=3376631 RepID=UPI003C174580